MRLRVGKNVFLALQETGVKISAPVGYEVIFCVMGQGNFPADGFEIKAGRSFTIVDKERKAVFEGRLET